jgi:hypothetical protein
MMIHRKLKAGPIIMESILTILTNIFYRLCEQGAESRNQSGISNAALHRSMSSTKQSEFVYFSVGMDFELSSPSILRCQWFESDF